MKRVILIYILFFFTLSPLASVDELEDSLSSVSLESIMDKSASPKDCYKILTTLQSTKTHKFGFIPVPTSYYGEDSNETIHILVYYPHEITDKTTIFINGGPARPSHSSYAAFF